MIRRGGSIQIIAAAEEIMKIGSLTERHIDKLTEYGIAHLKDTCRTETFGPGETVIREGDPVSAFYIVMSGMAKVCTTAANGKNLILCFYVSDGMLGDLELMADYEDASPADRGFDPAGGASCVKKTATATVIAVSSFECLLLPYAANRKEIRSNVVFLNQTARELSRKLMRSSENYTAMSLKSGEARLADYILRGARRDVFSDVLTDTACSVGVSYRHMFRILDQFCRNGILEKKENGYYIRDRQALMNCAHD